MWGYIAKRFSLFVPTLFLVTALVFLLLRIIPGDPARLLLAGEQGEVAYTQEDLAELQAKLGTDKPLITQYGVWVLGLVRLDFGESIYYSSLNYDAPVWDDIKNRFPITFELTVLALLMSFAVAIPLGVVSALYQDKPVDYASRIITIIGIALPNFWVAIMIVFVLSTYFDWLPPLAYIRFEDGPWTNIQQMFFPALALATSHTAFVARITRSATLEVFREDYIRTARSKGLAETVVIGRHALKNALLPVITVLGYEFGRLMGGTVIIEAIFGIPGMGTLLITSITNRDYPSIQGIVVVITVLVLVLNVVTDLVYAWLNPRIRYA